MKKIISLILINILLLISVAPISAATPSTKEEVVYGILNHDGSVDSLYVVNIFDGGNIIDYGIYNTLTNLTTKESLKQSDDIITVNTTAEKFHYQGNLTSKELPWKIIIKYYMNDIELPATELAGTSGKLKIKLQVTKNPDFIGTFYDNFGLQIALLLNNKLSTNIIADNATIAEAGGSKQLNFTVLPGNPFEGTVTADVKNFKMDAISINAIRLAFDINIDSSQFTEQFSELIKGIEGLDDGAGELLDGLNELSGGIKDYVVGLKAFNDGIGQLPSGARQIHSGASSLSNGLTEIVKQNVNINKGALAIQSSTFDAVNAQLEGMGLGLPVLTPDNYSNVLANIPDLAAVKLQLDSIAQFVQGLKGYTDGVSQLESGAKELSNGTKKFKDSLSELVTSANIIYDGAVKINSGIEALQDGLTTYKEGTKDFRSKTSGINNGIDKQIKDLMDEIFGTDDRVQSFVSPKNTDLKSVQFVLKTSPIEIPLVPVSDVTEPVKLNFWQKLLQLFGL